MNGLIRRRNLYELEGDPNLLLQLLGNSYGNTNALWVDTSIYATNATQNSTSYRPTLTSDKFGTGNYGYVFNVAEFDRFYVADNDRFTFSDINGDLPFSVKFKIIFNTNKLSFILTKRDDSNPNCEWYIVLSSNRLYIRLTSDGNIAKYIQASCALTPTIGQIYDIKTTYTGSSSNTGIEIWIDGVQKTLIRETSGDYTKMKNTNANITIGTVIQAVQNGLDGALTDIEIWKGVI